MRVNEHIVMGITSQANVEIEEDAEEEGVRVVGATGIDRWQNERSLTCGNGGRVVVCGGER